MKNTINGAIVFAFLCLFPQHSISEETNSLRVEINGGNFVQEHHIHAFGESLKFEYSQVNLRVGKWHYGQFSFPVEFAYSKVTQDWFGNYMAGINLIERWDVVDCFYVQSHVGILCNDVYKNEYQRYIGSPVEFSLGAALGTRLNLPSDFSLVVEYKGEHISNAGLADRNGGLNAAGFIVGVGKRF